MTAPLTFSQVDFFFGADAYFRNTGLERSSSLSEDLGWFREQGEEIPNPSAPGIAYSAYLKELAENSQPSFLCHFYNVYFAHATGGLKIGRQVGFVHPFFVDFFVDFYSQVSEKLGLGRELELYKWDDEDVFELLEDAREKLNKLGEV